MTSNIKQLICSKYNPLQSIETPSRAKHLKGSSFVLDNKYQLHVLNKSWTKWNQEQGWLSKYLQFQQNTNKHITLHPSLSTKKSNKQHQQSSAPQRYVLGTLPYRFVVLGRCRGQIQNLRCGDVRSVNLPRVKHGLVGDDSPTPSEKYANVKLDHHLR